MVTRRYREAVPVIGAVTTAGRRGLAVLGRVSMYRLALGSLAGLAVVALGLSAFGLVVPAPVELLVSAGVLAGVGIGSDIVAHALAKRPLRLESSLITAGILLFVLRPTTEPMGLLGLAIASLAAVASKYLVVWRGRHIVNPAAFGATVVTVVSALLPLDAGIGASAWWIGSPLMLAPVLLLGVLVLLRTEKLLMAGVFGLAAFGVGFLRTAVQMHQAGLQLNAAAVAWQLVSASPLVFLAAFMLSEPLTLPPRRWQQLVVAVVVGVGVGWPIPVGYVTLGQERALLIGNLVAFALARRRALRLRLRGTRQLTPSTRELTFHAEGAPRFAAGQYVELEVPHRRPDARGTRREFSIVSAPEDLPTMRIAYRNDADPQSSYKNALAAVAPGSHLDATGVWGDFLLPADPTRPLLLIAGGIGITPFISHLRHLKATGETRDVTLVYAVGHSSELAFRDEIEAAGIPVVVFCSGDGSGLPEPWQVRSGQRLNAETLVEIVPDLAERHCFVSGPPRLVADLIPALSTARSITTDAFAGY